MIILFFLSSGLFLGWSLGANDAANIFGTAVGTRMLRFKTAAIVGSIIGIGIYKGGKQIKFNILGGISLGWIATPIAAGIITFFMLFFVNNVFRQDVGGDRQLIQIIQESTPDSTTKNIQEIITYDGSDTSLTQTIGENGYKNNDVVILRNNKNILFYFIIGLSVLLIIAIALIFWLQKLKRHSLLASAQHRAKSKSYKLKIEQLERGMEDKMHLQDNLSKELKFRQGEMVTMAMSIIRKNEFLNNLKGEVVKIRSKVVDQETRLGLNKLSLMITQDLSIDRDREKFQMNISTQHSNFIQKLTESFPTMTENEKRLASLLRLNLSSKEIASILNISPKSVEMNRYRLRKKLKVNPKVNLNDFIRQF